MCALQRWIYAFKRWIYAFKRWICALQRWIYAFKRWIYAFKRWIYAFKRWICADTVFQMVDRDDSGTISFSEFASWLTRRQVMNGLSENDELCIHYDECFSIKNDGLWPQIATQGFVTPGFLRELQVN